MRHMSCTTTVGGHTGAGMSFGQGMTFSYSWKQKINMKSSREAKLAGWGGRLAGVHPLGALLQAEAGI
jgi:hypothetical protein